MNDIKITATRFQNATKKKSLKQNNSLLMTKTGKLKKKSKNNNDNNKNNTQKVSPLPLRNDDFSSRSLEIGLIGLKN